MFNKLNSALDTSCSPGIVNNAHSRTPCTPGVRRDAWNIHGQSYAARHAAKHSRNERSALEESKHICPGLQLVVKAVPQSHFSPVISSQNFQMGRTTYCACDRRQAWPMYCRAQAFPHFCRNHSSTESVNRSASMPLVGVHQRLRVATAWSWSRDHSSGPRACSTAR